MLLEIKNLSSSYGTHEVLHHINLELAEGEFVSLLGPSGSGKSTLLKSIAGLIDISAGSIYLGDTCIDTKDAQSRDMVLIFQDLRLFPHLNVWENVAFPLKLQGMKRAERNSRACELLRQVELEGFEDRRINELSGGQQQRVVLARAIAANPRVLLLDEPFSSLDAKLRANMQDLLMKLHRELGMTMLLVTHDQDEALMLSDRVAIISKGRIIRIASGKDLYDNPAHVEVADYFCAGNRIEGRVKAGVFEAGNFRLACEAAEGNYTLMLRPEDIQLRAGTDFEITHRAQVRNQQVLKLKQGPLELKAYSCGDAALKTHCSICVDPARILLFPR